ncbi:LysR substrate-binding domain-containing protein [Actinopolymorpha pittospori]|uniref:DNA-binding transcriptional LysR family regulator n=1 Tax=Actinopolymorpha pittospori TaxID=648752 RepID=A0A927RNH0_9ACTN|nr:DNA-binding transcriptional LysR family regulator [Actinopolymorpha pittospori]
MLEVSSRSLRYFAVLAEELHFTHAAQRLHIAQPVLSKAIRRLESDLDVVLLVRSRQRVALSDAGRALLPVARRVLADLEEGLAQVRRVHRRDERVLRVGYHSSLPPALLQPLTAAFAGLRPGWRIELRGNDWTDPARVVVDGTVDAAFLRLPVPGQDSLEIEVLGTESRCVVLPVGHPLASRRSVRLRDLQDEPFVAMPVSAGVFRDFWLGLEEFERPPVVSTEVRNPDDFFAAIATGRGVAMIAEPTTAMYQRPDIVYRLVEDARPGKFAVAWRQGSADPLLRDFVRACIEVTAAPR